MTTEIQNLQRNFDVQNAPVALTQAAKVIDHKDRLGVSSANEIVAVAAKKIVRVTFDRKMIEELESALMNTAPPEQPLTKERVLAGLALQIKMAREAGHTNESISVLLQARGLEVSKSEIARVLTQFKLKSAGQKTRGSVRSVANNLSQKNR
jgi:hypothetical protein